MQEYQNIPKSTWRFLGLAALTLLIVVIAGISLISAGVFDPELMGETVQQVEPVLLNTERNAYHLEHIASADGLIDYNIWLQANPREGETDIGYGLGIGSVHDIVLIGVSPVGYVTVTSSTNSERSLADLTKAGDEVNQIMPWRSWPHVQRGRNDNEIWLQVQNGHLREVRINRELLWDSDIALPGSEIYIWLESYGDKAAVNFEEFRIDEVTGQVNSFLSQKKVAPGG